MSKLHIAHDLSLPKEAVTQTFAILAKRGVGKTYTASVLAEEMLKASLQVVVVDPIGVWWGLRASADGKHEGLEIIVMGGEHGDVPLESTGGELVADFVVEHGRSVVLDLSSFRKGESVRFMTSFAETLYRRNRAPLHLIVDEADAFAPQKTMRGEGGERLLGAMEDIVRRGRARGLGVTLVTQRAAVLNKNVLTQTEVLVCLRTISPQDRDAVEAWVHAHDFTSEQWEAFVTSLPMLPIGTAWFWSPGWLDIFKKVHVRKRETFDSSATPKVGEKIFSPKNLKPVDLESLKEKMAATIEQAKANDPKELRREIARLKAELQKRPDGGPAPKEKIVEKPVLKDSQITRIEKLLDRASVIFDKHRSELFSIRSDALEALEPVRAALKNWIEEKRGVVRYDSTGRATGRVFIHHKPVTMRPVDAAPSRSSAIAQKWQGEEIPRPQQRILDSLATLESLGLRDVSKSNVAVFADQSPSSSGYTNNLGRLRSIGLIHYPQQGRVALTDEGRKLAQSDGTILSRGELHRAWFSKLANPKVRILERLIETYPDPIEKDKLAELAGQSPTSSGYTNNLGNLRSLGLVDYPQPGLVAATDLLFPEGLA